MIVAAAALATSGTLRTPVPVGVCIVPVRRDRFSGMDQAVGPVLRKWNDGPLGGIRL